MACHAVRWSAGDDEVIVPFVEQRGSLLLLVSGHQRERLLDSGGGWVTLDAHTLGSVRLTGEFRAVAQATSREVLDRVRACHRECLDCPARGLSDVVALEVDLVELGTPGCGYQPIDVVGYVQAQPDWMLALGVQIQQHLNADHLHLVVAAACAFTGVRTEQVLSAQVEWIDGCGFDVGVIDESGGRRLRVEFANPVVDPDQLSDAVHVELERAAGPAGA